MNLRILCYSMLVLTGISSLSHAKNKSKEITAGEPKKPESTYFEGCGKKDKAGKWTEFYVNCKGFDGAQFSPAPPCKENFVTVNEVVPTHLVSHLKQCIYLL